MDWLIISTKCRNMLILSKENNLDHNIENGKQKKKEFQKTKKIIIKINISQQKIKTWMWHQHLDLQTNTSVVEPFSEMAVEDIDAEVSQSEETSCAIITNAA